MAKRTTRERGSALIIAMVVTIMATLMVVGFLMVPLTTVKGVSAGASREKALQAADAGVRDALVWRNSHNTTATVLPAFNTGTANTWVTFGDTQAQSQYKWTITNAASGTSAFNKIVAQGRALGLGYVNNGGPDNLSARFIEVDIEVYLFQTPRVIPSLGAVNMTYPSTQANPGVWWINSNGNDSASGLILWTTQQPGVVTGQQNGGNGPWASGTNTDAGATNVVPGITYRNTNMTFGSTAWAAGNPPQSTSATSSTWNAITQLVTDAQAATSNGTTVFKYTWGVDALPLGGGYSNALIYVRLPAGSVITTEIMGQSGASANSTGVLILDVENNVDFSRTTATADFYDQNGNGYFHGSMLFYQRGDIYVRNDNSAKGSSLAITDPTDGLSLIKQNGNQNGNLGYSANAVAAAFNALGGTPWTIRSYRVTDNVLH